MKKTAPRPQINNYANLEGYIKDMISYRKKTEPSFSVLAATKSLRKVSPSLISLIVSKKRKISIDRLDELAKLLNLNAAEKYYFKNRLEGTYAQLPSSPPTQKQQKRKEVGTHLLTDWLNVYVKDSFQLPRIQSNPDLIYSHLSALAPAKRIKKSLDFLLKNGYLKKTPDGKVVIDTTLTTSDPKVSDKKIRAFHKNALKLAKTNIDLFSIEERLANTATIALTPKKYRELMSLIEDFAEAFKNFAEKETEATSEENIQVYQLILNLSPIGGGKNEV